MLQDKLKDISRLNSKKGTSKNVKKVIPVSWKKLIPGIVSIAFGVWLANIYLADYTNMIAGAVGAIAISFGGFLAYQSFQQNETGYAFNTANGRKPTGEENAIVIFAERNPETKKDVPVKIKFVKLTKIPKGARLHLVRNLGKHFYELWNNPETKKLEPVRLPDKKAFPPELFQVPAAMQTYREAVEFSPPNLMQKIAPGLILAAMGIVGLLMVITGG